MLKPVSINQIPVIDVIKATVEQLAQGVEIENSAYDDTENEDKILSLRWENSRTKLRLRRPLLDDLRDAPNRHNDDWQKLIQKLSMQITQTLQELGYYSGKIGFKR